MGISEWEIGRKEPLPAASKLEVRQRESDQEREPDVLRRRLIGSVTYSTLVRPLVMVFTIGSSVVVARTLGPDLLAVISAATAVAAGLTSLCDLGISQSLVRIVADVSVKHGDRAAKLVSARMMRWKLWVTVIALMAITVLHYTGAIDVGGKVDLRIWFFALLFVRIPIGIAVLQQSSLGIAAFRNTEVLVFEAVTTVLGPLLSVALAMLTHDPYPIIATATVLELVHFLLLRKYVPYDLDREVTRPMSPLMLRDILHQYGSYMTEVYLVFFFNRFVIHFPLLYVVLTRLHEPAAVIANMGLAMTIVTQAWALTNLPHANLHVPLLARLFASGNERQFREIQRLFVAMSVLTSALVLIGMQVLGGPLLLLLYGREYESGIGWGMQALPLALMANVFCMGNSTLRQRGRHRVNVVSLGVALLSIAVGMLLSVKLMSTEQRPAALLLCIIGGRAVYWLLTDAWLDWSVFHWEGTGVKFRAIAAMGISLFVAYCVHEGSLAIPVRMLAATLAVLVFWVVFRATGGVGERTRELVGGIVQPRYRSAAVLL